MLFAMTRCTGILTVACTLLFAAMVRPGGSCDYVDTPGVVPRGINQEEEISFSMSSIRIPRDDVDIKAGSFHQNTFEVAEKHVQLRPSESSNITGVRFNVETVPAAIPEHLRKPVLSRDDELERLQINLASYYCRQREPDESERKSKCTLRAEDIRIEATSEHEMNLVYSGGNGFLVAAVTAFAQHLPLQLSPDHIWSLITYAFAKHVDANAKELRSKFVKHKGKKRLLVVTPIDFRMAKANNPDTGASTKEWEHYIFAEFSKQIQDYIGEEMHAAITADFSATTAASRAATEITLMSATKNYFSFGMLTLCGIPSITLQGSEEDWVTLRKRTEELGRVMLPEFSAYWMPLVLQILDKVVESYRGEVDHSFWQSMVKLRNNGMASGYREFISGWMQVFFPYLVTGELNKQLRPWHEMYFQGPDPDKFPSIVSSAPVDWDYNGQLFNMDFHAGVTGVSQDPSDGTLTPVVGWHVTHSPPKPPLERFKDITEEIKDLLLGHKEEAEAEQVDEMQPWFVRVKSLREEQAVLAEQLRGGQLAEEF